MAYDAPRSTSPPSRAAARRTLQLTDHVESEYERQGRERTGVVGPQRDRRRDRRATTQWFDLRQRVADPDLHRRSGRQLGRPLLSHERSGFGDVERHRRLGDGRESPRTVGDAVTGVQVGPTLTLYAAGVNSPPPQGVGVYAIPSSKWGQAITDGWPIVSETGGLGTQSSPWVGFTSATTVANSPDFLMGQSIYNSHKRVTWLSFWTVSGPLKGQPQTTTNYYNHGFAAGAWVATQIDQYRALGVGLKPDWVIFDPEGYPDNHSGLDAPAGSSSATLALYATYWSAMLKGWASGMASVDPNSTPACTPRSPSTATTTWSRSRCRSSSPSPSATAVRRPSAARPDRTSAATSPSPPAAPRRRRSPPRSPRS
jgi:hypothetical protein